MDDTDSTDEKMLGTDTFRGDLFQPLKSDYFGYPCYP
jgi:hypothetical protein